MWMWQNAVRQQGARGITFRRKELGFGVCFGNKPHWTLMLYVQKSIMLPKMWEGPWGSTLSSALHAVFHSTAYAVVMFNVACSPVCGMAFLK